MNTIKTLILVILFTFSIQTSANTDRPSNELDLVSQQVDKLLVGSELVIYKDTVVTIKFKLDKNDKIIILSNDSDDYHISEYIKSKLNHKKLSIKKTNSYRFYSVPVKFLSTIKTL
ncbi:hypothetical protein [Wocania ichthyoenteri]|uniref:hypothetical protein n=1 Tax=Wocania ichthyoenteri TaxID=1230531 RepID=UPI00053DB9C1|nr:hypothetical protein [Wocania ichthyoenteri]